jgi:hypothetical protein
VVPAHVAKGSYIYAAGADGDGDWDKHTQNVAHTASILDALLRPALNDKVGLSYPAERNLMIRLKGVGQEAGLYAQQAWRVKTTMDLTAGVKDFDGSASAFGLGDAEGKKLEKSVKNAIADARVLVSSAAVTTDVPARVKSSIAHEVYSTHQQSLQTGSLKLASNVKESLLANTTTEMISRPRGIDTPAKKLAIAEFRDRPRHLWESINASVAHEKSTVAPVAGNVVNSIDEDVDEWRNVNDAESAARDLFTEADHCLTLKPAYIRDLREGHENYYQFSGQLTRYSRMSLVNARNTLGNHIRYMQQKRTENVDQIDVIIGHLETVPATQEDKTNMLVKLRQERHYFAASALLLQISVFEDILKNIVSKTGPAEDELNSD